MKNISNNNDIEVYLKLSTPKNWDCIRLKYLANITFSNVGRGINPDNLQIYVCHYPIVYNNEYISEDTQFDNGSCNQDEFYRYKLKKGLVIITKDSESPDDIGIPCYVKSEMINVVCGYHLAVIEIGNEIIDSEFLFRYLQSRGVKDYFKIHSKGVTRFGLGKYYLNNLPIAFPDITIQLLVAKYLNRKTKFIDILIKAINKKIILQKEYLTSLIDRCITKGLSPNQAMKNSENEWIGTIPANWKVMKISWISLLVTQGGNPNYNLGKASDEYRVLKTKSLYNDIIHYGDSDKISKETYLREPKSTLCKGDLLISIVGKGSIGKVNVFNPNDNRNYIYSRSLGCIRFNNKVNPYFIKYVFQSTRGKDVIKLGIKGSTGQEVVQTSYIKELRIQVPHINEQKRIVDYLDKQSIMVEKCINNEERIIELLKEYRQSLISEVVTGKIDVRNE